MSTKTALEKNPSNKFHAIILLTHLAHRDQQKVVNWYGVSRTILSSERSLENEFLIENKNLN